MTEECTQTRDAERLALLLSAAPLFHQPWWLEAVAPGRWGYAVAWRGHEPAAIMPYVVRRGPWGQTWLRMPPLTQFLGPWLRASSAKYAGRLAEQKDLMTELIEALPPHRYFAENFHHSLTNWLPFFWHGFNQTTRYTYVLNSLDNLDAVWDGFQPNIRGDVRKAQKQVKVVDHLGLERFIQVHAMTFRRQGLEAPVPRETIRRVDAACAQRGIRKIFFAVDAKDQVHAACYIVWGPEVAYYLMAGSDPVLRHSGASSLVLWEAIQFARTVARSFDFEGSMIEPVERCFRAFGASQVPYFSVSRDRRGPIVRGYLGLRSRVGRLVRALFLWG